MPSFHFDRLMKFLAGIEPEMAVFWAGLAIFTVALAVLMYTRWGQYKPLRKCMGLSILAHLIMACYAATIQIAMPTPTPPEQFFHVSIGDGEVESSAGNSALSLPMAAKDQPWETIPTDAAAQPEDPILEHQTADPPVEPKRLVRNEDTHIQGDPALDHVAVAEVKALPSKPENVVRSTPGESAETIEAPEAQRRDAAYPLTPIAEDLPERLAGDAQVKPVRASTEDMPTALLQEYAPLPRIDENDAPEALVASAESLGGSPNPLRQKPAKNVVGNASGSAAGSIAGTEKAANGASNQLAASAGANLGGKHGEAAKEVPNAYRLRVAPNREGVAQSRGGSPETEAAVKAALKWLADNQAADGSWNPRTHEAGKENKVLDRDRQGAGSRADSAMTGLSLLAFLASGHTHLEGPYREDVRRGLEYLMRIQATDGNLAGQAASYEFMYCHAMAACALSEAYGMTRDARLREPVRRAVNYTLAAQDSVGGGWRYKPGDAGDMSQMGWQLMTLKSAELAGFPIPDQTRQGVIRFLRSVSSGKYGGRSSYRVGEQQSRSMTAEALVCWQFLGLPRQHPAGNEAGDFLMEELPGTGTYNLYYWYYATLGMYQLQGTHWQRWNEAMRTTVIGHQVKEGPQAGSFDTADLWGSYGGRVYTTALATLTLEVYYRFLPLYTGVNAAEDREKAK